MTAILKVENLRKTYRKGRRPAVDGLSFEVEEGAIYAFVGPNGAGKTTTISVLSTLMRFDSGDVRVGGYAVDKNPRDVRRLLGYIPDEFGLYGEMLATEYLDFFASCYGIDPSRRPPMIADLLDLVGLSQRANDQVRTLSRGMRQRLGLARALVHEPVLVVADEPAAGLDPRARVDLREIFRALQEMGKTIFLSSHVLRELDEVATHVGIIEMGRLVASGPLDEVRQKMNPQRRIRMTFLNTDQAGEPSGKTLDDAQAWLAACSDVISVEPTTEPGNGNGSHPALLVALSGGEDRVAWLLRTLIAEGFPLLSYTEERETLESLFLNLTQGGVS